MTKNKLFIIFAIVSGGILLFQLDCTGMLIGKRGYIRMQTFDTETIKDSEISIVNKPDRGNYVLHVWVTPFDSAVMCEPHKPAIFECTIEMTQGENAIEKKQLFTIEGATTRTRANNSLYNVPNDFSANKEISITIKNISFDDKFFRYYKTVGFTMEYTRYPVIPWELILGYPD